MALRVQDDRSQNGRLSELKLLSALEQLLDELQICFAQKRTFERAKTLGKALLCSDAPHTITNWITAAGKQHQDWSANYNFFSKARWEPGDIFDAVLASIADCFAGHTDFFTALDEVHLPKSGKKIAAARILRDPLALPYVNGLHRALRFINCCALVTSNADRCAVARAMCIGFELAPPAKKPGKKASDEERAAYKKAQKQCAISERGASVIQGLRERMDKVVDLGSKMLVMSVDGGFTNKAVFERVPQRTVLVGRIRKDASLYGLPQEYCGKGRRRKYGDKLPTPEQVRLDPQIPWKTCRIWAAGKEHEVRYKELGPILWKSGCKDRRVRLIVIEPLAYRPTKKSKLRYRDPAYLLVSDEEYDVMSALQCYFHRWEIEVSHRDAKSLVGVGDAQVRNPASVDKVPRFAMAIYSLILLAAHQAYGEERSQDYGVVGKWRNDQRPRASTHDIINLFRQQVQQAGIESFEGFATHNHSHQTPQKAKQVNTEIEKTAKNQSYSPALTNRLRC